MKTQREFSASTVKSVDTPGIPRGWLRWTVSALCALAISALGGNDAQARSDPRIGRAEKVVMDVRALMPETERRLVVNEDVFRDDTIETKARSAARLVFRDETYLSIGPESRVRLANLPVAQDDGQPFVVDAAQGVFKFVSGRLRSDRYRIETPAATIGVRGTIVWMTVRADGLTEVAAQTGEVTVCAQGACVTLQPGTYSRAEPGMAPTPPGKVPDAFYDRVRDMLIRLLMASDGFGLNVDRGLGAGGSGGDGVGANGLRGAGKAPGIAGPGLATRGGRGGRAALQTVPERSQTGPPRPAAPAPDGGASNGGGGVGAAVRIDGPASAVLLLVGLLALAILLGRHGPAAVAGRRRG